MDLFQKYLGLKLISYVDGDGGAGGSGGSEGGEGGDESGKSGDESGKEGGDEGGDEGGKGGEGDDGGDDEGKKKMSKYENWKAMNQRKKEEAAGKKKDQGSDGDEGGDSKKQSEEKKKSDFSDEEIDDYINKQIDERLQQAEGKRSSQENFFSQMKEAGDVLSEFGLEYDKAGVTEIVKEIEADGFRPDDLIFLANKEVILKKLSMTPKEPMTSDSGGNYNPRKASGTMEDFVAGLQKQRK